MSIRDGSTFDVRCGPTGVNQFILRAGDLQWVLFQCPTCEKTYRFRTGVKTTHKCATLHCRTPYLLTYSALLTTDLLVKPAVTNVGKREGVSAPEYIGAEAFQGHGIKVAWVQDLAKLGGSELSGRTCVRVGQRLGFDIVGVTPHHFHAPILEDADVLVINNFWTFNTEQWLAVMDAIRNQGKPYIKYEHDYREIMRRSRYEAWKLFHRAARSVFISPKHMQDHVRELGLVNAAALPLAIDVDLFKPDPDVERRKGVWLNTSGNFLGKCKEEFKGFLKRYPEDRFEVIIGTNSESNTLPDQRLTPISAVPQDRLPALYSSADGLIHMPDLIPWAGERIVFEAALCGIKKFALNHNVGHRSWGEGRLKDPEALREWLRQSVFDFWKIVEEVANG